MKRLNLLVWLTQLGLSTAVPLVGFVLLGVWLRSSCGLGVWAVITGAVIGILTAITGFINTLKNLQHLTAEEKQPVQTTVSFNEHD